MMRLKQHQRRYVDGVSKKEQKASCYYLNGPVLKSSQPLMLMFLSHICVVVFFKLPSNISRASE